MIYQLALDYRSLVALLMLCCAACQDASTTAPSESVRLSATSRSETMVTGRTDSSESEGSEDDALGAQQSCEAVEVIGTACAPNGAPVSGAEVTVHVQTCAGDSISLETVTDISGRYSFTGLSGAGEIHIRAGLFTDRFEIDVSGDEPLDLTAGQTCFRPNAAKLAVITGEFDSIESSISQLGFDYDAYCGGVSSAGARLLLSDPELISQYDAIFINSGSKIDFSSRYDGAERVKSLRAFVEAGGSLYVSDLAAEALQETFPDVFALGYDKLAFGHIPSCCSCGVTCDPSCGIQTSAENTDYSGSACIGSMPERDYGCEIAIGDINGYGASGLELATIQDDQLRQAIGRDELEIFFDRDEWIQLSPHPKLEPLIEIGFPIMARYTAPSGGRVIYTSFHQAPSDDAQRDSDLGQLFRALLFEL